MKQAKKNTESAAMDEAKKDAGQEEARTSRRYRRILRRCLVFVLCAVLCLLFAAGAVLAFMQTQSGQEYLKEKLNALLEPCGVTITGLAGSLPLSNRVSLKMHDNSGTWLELDNCSLDLDLSSISTVLGLAVTAQSGHLYRVPETEAGQEDGKDNEANDTDIQKSFRAFASATEGIPSFIPGLQLTKLSVPSFIIERAVFDSTWPAQDEGETAQDEACALKFELDGRAGIMPDSPEQWHNPNISADIAIVLLPLPAKPAEARGEQPVPQTGPGVQEGGKQDEAYPACEILPDTRFDRLSIRLSLKGSVQDPCLDLEASTGTFSNAGITLQNPRIFASVPQSWLPAILESGQKPVPLVIGAAALLQEKPVSCTFNVLTAFAEGMPQFTIVPQASGPGFDLAGSMAFALAPSLFEAQKEPLPAGAMPGEEPSSVSVPLVSVPLSSLEGSISLRVSDFSLVQLLQPGMKGQGSLDLGISVTHDKALHEIAASLQAKDLAFSAGESGTTGVKELALDSRLHNLDFAAGIDITKILASLSLKAKALHAGGLAPVSLDFSTGYSYEKGTLHLKAEGGISGQIALEASAKEKTISLNTLKVRVPARNCGLHLQKPAVIRFADKGILPVTVPQCSIRLEPSGQIQAVFAYDPQKLQGTLNIEKLDTGAWQKVVPSLPKAVINARASLAGDLDNPAGSLALTIKDLSVPGQKGLAVSSSLNAKAQSSAEGCRIETSLKLDEATKRALGISRFSCDSALLIPRTGEKLDFSGLQKAPLKAALDYKGSLSPLWKLARQSGRRLDGDLSLTASVKGSASSPDASAVLKLAKGSFADMELGAEVRDISLTARAQCKDKPESAKVDLDLSLNDGRKEKGLITVKGTLSPYTMTIPGITANVRDFSPLRRRDIKATLSGNISVSGKMASPSVTGHIAVSKGSILIEELTLPASSVTTLDLVEGPKENVLKLRADKNRQAAGRKATSLPGSLSLDIDVSKLFVEGYGLDTEWKANLRASGPLDAVGLSGDVEAVRGKLSLLSRTFTMDEGRVSFAGGTEPFLNLKMTTSANAVDASVILEGSLAKISKLKPRFESTPSMPEDDILAYLLFGKPASDLSQFEMLQLAQNVAVLAAFGTGSGTRSAIKNVTGLDVVNISQDKNGNASFEMGKYLFDNVYAGVQKNSDSGSETSAIVRWELNKNSNAEITTGGSETNVGVKWKMDY